MTHNPYRLEWVPDLQKRDADIYIAIADALGADIKSGRLKMGQRLPPRRLLAFTLGINLGTVQKAYKLAEKRGFITGEVGRGSFVRGGTSPTSSWPNENPHDRAIDFCDNFPCPIKNVGLFQKHIMALANAAHLGSLLQYQQNSAWADHKDVGGSWLRRFGIEAEPQNILITSGAINAGFISLLTLCRTGETLLTEEFTSQAIKGAAERLRLRVRGIKMDKNGIIPEHLEELLRKEKAAAVYLVPTLHNPTATLLPIGRRRQIAKILAKHGAPLIEDDVFAPLLETPLPPISSFIPDLSFYIASLSKAIAPGLRTAFLKVPQRFYQDALDNLRMTNWLASPLLVELAGGLIREGHADKLIQEQRAEIKKRQAFAKEAFAGCDCSMHPNAMHVWLRLPAPWRAAQFKDALLQREVVTLSSDSFATDRSNPTHALRICLGTPPTASKVKEGLQIIRETLNRTSG